MLSSFLSSLLPDLSLVFELHPVTDKITKIKIVNIFFN